MDQLNSVSAKAIELMMAYAPKVVLAIVTLTVGLWLIGKLSTFMGKTMDENNLDASLKKFLISLSGILLKVILFISVASMVGIKTTSFVAVLGAGGLAVGLALQGSLANFAGGALILLFRPFKIGDFIETQGQMGTVKGIQVFNTILTSPDNKRIILPNGPVASGPITNFSAESTRRIDWTFGIGYSDDLLKAKKLLEKLITSDPRALKDPAPMVAVSELADSSVNFVVRCWVKPEDYWGIHFDMIERVKLEFDKNNISIPFPQQDVHVFTQGNGLQAPAGTTAVKN